jgi:TonB family protein
MEESMPRRLIILLIVTLATALASAQVRPSSVRVSSSVMENYVIKKVPPQYPRAGDAHIQGIVVLHVRVSKTGDVENIELVSGHPVLAPAAIDAVKQWKYRPYELNGWPVEVDTQVTVNFTLSDKPKVEGVVGDIPGGAAPDQQGGLAPSTTPSGPRIPVPQRVRISSGVASGLVEKKVPPAYPDKARQAHIEGAVVLKAIIDKQGNVENLQLISGHPALVLAAIDAVKEWKYRPYMLNGEPVEVETQVMVTFRLAEL